MSQYLVVFVGAGIGGCLRHFVNVLAGAYLSLNFPFGTLIVNILGSFLMGVLAGYLATRAEGSHMLRLFCATGVLGGFTTFSAFTLDTRLLLERGEVWQASAYILFSILLALFGLSLGLMLMRGAAV